MKDIITVAKKEFKSFISDKIILMQMLILPLCIVLGYSLLMSLLIQANTEPVEKEVKAYSINAPTDFKNTLDELNVTAAPENDEDKFLKQVKEKELDLLIVFPDDFKVSEPGNQDLSNIDVYYNSEVNSSIELYSKLTVIFTSMQPRIFTVNASADKTYDVIDPSAAFRLFLCSIIPLIAFMAVFLVCMNLAANSIAGDKEKGFLNTLLVSPIKRYNLAAGKSVSILVVAIISSISSFIGVMLSLPKLSNAMDIEEKITYSVSEYLMLLGALVTGAFTLAALLLIISTLAKDVKQATTIAPFFMFAIIIPSMLSTTPSFSEAVKNLGTTNYIIPVWNSTQILQDVLSLNTSGLHAILTIISNVIVSFLGVLFVGHLFNKEKIVNG